MIPAHPRFPRASRYHPDWILAGVSGGANPLWLAEWLAEAVELRPGQRVLDLGCGRALSSIFFHREFGVQVFAADLWCSPRENLERARDAGAEGGVIPLRADVHALPFAAGFFDAVLGIDSFMYFGTDDLCLNNLARFVKPGGTIAIAQAGLVREIGLEVPSHLRAWWDEERPYCLHTAEWWLAHWRRSEILDGVMADTMQDGWRLWLEWLRAVAPDNQKEIQALEADQGRNFAYVRAVGRRRADAVLFDPRLSVPYDYAPKPLLRGAG